jgi:hypothetical protein
MSLVGWDDASLDSLTEIDFKSSPFWVRLLALTPVFEKYAYPIAVRRGFGTIWIPKDSAADLSIFLVQGWQVKVGEPDDRDRFLSGSLATLSIISKPIRKPKVKFTRVIIRIHRNREFYTQDQASTSMLRIKPEEETILSMLTML